ncbi:uncharacterized protein LOC129776526 isoform X2 [Toxorhynchites rutilus septentrionalis]|nr:uncharacterized protein LOC129776526 isoform X2 [Toxorhynchites rutilus septentrionalis]XP_055638199.1 uncharacterized protein LOC129776526 isoform X2 [Toxorhynchites rutilus septentrionalis]XP_055638200.1 uncharacterized protein LOC129776526 isoform X2 [Toxorhynchites rutilus septentrionalis]
MNPPNAPELRPIEKYWAIMKQALRKNPKVVKSEADFKRKWISVDFCGKMEKKLQPDVVQNLKDGVKRKFSFYCLKFSKGSVYWANFYSVFSVMQFDVTHPLQQPEHRSLPNQELITSYTTVFWKNTELEHIDPETDLLYLDIQPDSMSHLRYMQSENSTTKLDSHALYGLHTIRYVSASGSFSATRCIRQKANFYSTPCRNIHIDVLLCRIVSEHEAIQFHRKLHKWASNSVHRLKNFTVGLKDNRKIYGLNSSSIRNLGRLRQPANEVFWPEIPTWNHLAITKHLEFSATACVFDLFPSPNLKESTFQGLMTLSHVKYQCSIHHIFILSRPKIL